MLATWGTSTGRNPTLDLQFAGATSLDNRVTFSRGSQATLFDSTGALVYAKHNLLLQSQDFATTWTASNTSVSADSVTAPDGTNTADTLTGAAGSGLLKRIFQSPTIPAATCTFSVFAKAGTHNFIQFFYSGTGATTYANFDISTGTAGDFNGVSSSITAVGNGWYRCTHTFVANNTSANISLVDSNTAVRGATTSTTNNVYLWGAQLNQTPMEGGVTSSLSTYYPTVASAYYAPRFDYSPSTLAAQGLLIEEQRTNSIRNNTMQGAVAGTPGTLPTNWQTFTTLTGLTREIVGTGTESGITYIDIRLSGTPSGAGAYNIFQEAITTTAATSGQTWAFAQYSKLAAGSTSGITSIQNGIIEYSAASAFLTQGVTGFSPTAAALNTQRYGHTRTLTNASTAFIRSTIELNLNGAAIDITLRIGLPQLELGAFATSVIPTTTTALTRNADVASMTGTNFSSWFNSTQGTIYTEAVGVVPTSVSFVAQFNDLTTNNFIDGARYQTTLRGLVNSGGVNQATLIVGTAAGAVNKTALAYAANDIAMSANGAAALTDTSATIPVVTRFVLGDDGSGSPRYLNGYIQRISFWPIRLANSQLQALTS